MQRNDGSGYDETDGRERLRKMLANHQVAASGIPEEAMTPEQIATRDVVAQGIDAGTNGAMGTINSVGNGIKLIPSAYDAELAAVKEAAMGKPNYFDSIRQKISQKGAELTKDPVELNKFEQQRGMREQAFDDRNKFARMKQMMGNK